MTRPTPSDLAYQALEKARHAAARTVAREELDHRRYQTALASTCAEVKDVLAYWQAQGNDSLVAAILTGITLDNLPEGV